MKRAHRSEDFVGEPNQRRNRPRAGKATLLEPIETSVLTSDPETFVVRDSVKNLSKV